jgi:hypothetical protein
MATRPVVLTLRSTTNSGTQEPTMTEYPTATPTDVTRC